MTNVRYELLSTEAPNSVGSVEMLPIEEDTLPAYDGAEGKLPSYEEVRFQKGEDSGPVIISFAMEPVGELTVDGMPLGSELSFMGSFLVSFFFNWIGYLVAYCMSTTLAGQCGALAGFGLDMVKIGLLIRHYDYVRQASEYGHYQQFVVWAFVLVGWLSFFRGLSLFLTYKKAARFQARD